MTDISVIERVAESSPVVVVILLAACVVLWRKMNEEIAACRVLHAQSIEAHHKLADAITDLSERVKGGR